VEGSKSEISPRLLIGVVFIGVVVSLVVIEALFRVLGMLVKPPVRWSDRPVGYFMPESARSLQEKSVEAKRPGNFRVSVVGDSFTFGPSLQLVDTFPKKLESFLNLNSTPNRVEVLNRGYSGFSTVNEVDVVKRTLVENPDLLLLQITLNDAEPHILTPKARERLFEDKFSKLWIAQYWRSLAFLFNRLHNSNSQNTYIEYHSKFFFQPDTSKAFISALIEMKRVCQRRGVPFAAVLYPLFDFPFNDRYPFRNVHEFIKGVAERESIPFLDLEAAYRGVPHDRLQVIPGGDSHPNEIAHRIAAERVVAFLAQKKLLPDYAIPKLVFTARRGHKGKPAQPTRTWNRSLRPLQDPLFAEQQYKKRKAATRSADSNRKPEEKLNRTQHRREKSDIS
jgi:hypothetical protein